MRVVQEKFLLHMMQTIIQRYFLYARFIPIVAKSSELFAILIILNIKCLHRVHMFGSLKLFSIV